MPSVSPFIRASQNEEGAQLWVTGEIGVDSNFNDVRRALTQNSLEGGSAPFLNIFSHGGGLDDANAFYGWVEHSGIKATVRIWGTAMSAATVYAAAFGRESIEIHPLASLMIHEAHGGTDQMREIANDGLVRVYRKLTGLSEKKIREMMAATTTLNATEAVELGFAGKVMKSTMKLAAMYEAKPIENEQTPAMAEAKNTVKVPVKLTLAKALASLSADGAEVEIAVEEAVAAQLTEKDETIADLKKQIEVLEAAKPTEVITPETLEAVTNKVKEHEATIAAKELEVTAKAKEVETVKAELAELKKPLAERTIADNKDAKVGGMPGTDKDPAAEFTKQVFGQMTEVQKAVHAVAVKNKKKASA